MFHGETSDSHEIMIFGTICRNIPILMYTRRYRTKMLSRCGPGKRVDAAQERYRDVVTSGASEKERTTGGHIWSRGPRGSQVTPASDGASRFHDDVQRVSLSSLYLRVPPFLSSHSLFDAVLLARFACSPPCRAGHQKYRTVVPWVREMKRTREKNRREALFRDYRGLPAFWNRADRLHFQY